MRICPWTSLLGIGLLFGCASNKSIERGPQGTIAYTVHVESSEPGVKIEADGNYIGTTPCTLKIFGDKDGTFHNFGNHDYIVRATPSQQGELQQTKVYHTGGWFTSEDRIPNRIYFEMELVPVNTAASEAPSSPPAIPAQPHRGGSQGTGFFITDDGYIVSNWHVVKDATVIHVFAGDDDVRAKLVEKDIPGDLVLLKVSRTGKALALGNSVTARVGEDVCTLGFPMATIQGDEIKFTTGIISSLKGMKDDIGHFQISVPIQHGNSGGPLLDGQGRVIGVVDSAFPDVPSLLATGSVPQNVCYAIKGSRIQNLLESHPEVVEKLSTAVQVEKMTGPDLYESAKGSIVRIEAWTE
jgi:S1-C subfamily serine protease